jgi:hypothetical protein
VPEVLAGHLDPGVAHPQRRDGRVGRERRRRGHGRRGGSRCEPAHQPPDYGGLFLGGDALRQVGEHFAQLSGVLGAVVGAAGLLGDRLQGWHVCNESSPEPAAASESASAPSAEPVGVERVPTELLARAGEGRGGGRPEADREDADASLDRVRHCVEGLDAPVARSVGEEHDDVGHVAVTPGRRLCGWAARRCPRGSSGGMVVLLRWRLSRLGHHGPRCYPASCTLP